MKIASSPRLFGVACCFLLGSCCLKPAAASFYDTTEWQGPAGEAGDWFEPANWTNGVPAVTQHPQIPPNATIDNGGIARISGGTGRVQSIQIGLSQHGELVLEGGTLDAAYGIHLGSQPQSTGRLTINGGRVDAQGLFLGQNYGTGRVDQIGGHVDANDVTLGSTLFIFTQYSMPAAQTPDDYSRGEYNLAGGRVSSTNIQVGTGGVGDFRQTGGIVEIERRLTVGGSYSNFATLHESDEPVGGLFPQPVSPASDFSQNLVLLPTVPSRGHYELSGGSLTTAEFVIDNSGTVLQTGGSLRTDYLELTGNARYEFAAGSLRVESGLHANDDFDFAGSSVTLSAGSAIVNFAHAPKNAEHAKINVGPNSLTIFPAGYDVAANIGQFSTAGLVHFTGDDLSIPANRTVEGRGTITDHAIVGGKLLASQQILAAINLNGLELKAGGEVNLGDGMLNVPDDRTVIRNGSLKAAQINVYGTVDFSPLTTDPITGVWPRIFIYPQVTPGLARQTAGSVETSRLRITNGRYEISGGTLAVDVIDVGNAALGFPLLGSEEPLHSMTQRGGTVSVRMLDFNPTSFSLLDYRSSQDDGFYSEPLLPVPWPSSAGTARYEMHAGRLNADWITLNSGGRSYGSELIQTGGEVVVRELKIFGESSRYVLSGGSLQARRLQVGFREPVLEPSGNFAILDADAQVEVAGEFLLGSGAEFVAAAGSTIRLTRPDNIGNIDYPLVTGNSVAIHATDPQAVAGLNNLTLMFEGGSDIIATIEAAGVDRGPTLAGFYQNFSIDTLVIGGVEPASLSLVDLFQNQAGGTLPNALYVDHLVVNEGSTLNLNGLKLYYRTASIAASSLTADASFGIQVVPEPAAAVLAFVAAPLFIRRRAS
ncbi:hypothetical protein [Lacipirellula parvula]|uniref:Autotransporter-associated beta strand repeat protein n=1 Tax=Lacipirellula parvula TaxID=2650471 RepID=A0A5K7XBR3_9BACT|nr:hypothetical protein [Lacipirellula parvula]BBO33948.1 hypothetical protein PLANPX_3560 [Lacipirellula parvula]